MDFKHGFFRKEGFFSLFVLLLVGIFMIGFVSAGIVDWYNKLTGRATSGSTSINISVGNNAPTIGYVQPISATDPTEGGSKSFTFNFTATDTDGVSNLNSSTAQARFQKAGETTRYNNSCVQVSTSGNSANYSCTVLLYYYDASGSWTVNVSIEDINGARAENSSTTFTYNLLTSMTLSPSSLTWPSISLTDTDVGSNNDPLVINNTGNDESLSINVTGYDLQGEITPTEFIYASNFSVDNQSQGCSGVVMSNATSLNITNSILQRGNNSLNYHNATSGQEELYFCLKGVPPTISSQSYSSQAYGAWNVQIIT